MKLLQLLKLAGTAAIAATAFGTTAAFGVAPAAHADHRCTLGGISIVHPDSVPCVPGAIDEPLHAQPAVNQGGRVGTNAPALSVGVFNCWGQDIPFGYMCPSNRPNPSDWVACNTWPPTSVVGYLADCPRT